MNQLKVKYLYGTHSDFSLDVKKKVEAYFRQHRISKYANREMIVVALVFSLIYLGSYGLMMSGKFSGGTVLLLYLAMGLSFPSIFLNIAHTAAHQAFSASKKINKLLLLLLELIGMNSYIFEYLHNKVHHAFTSIEGMDVIVEEFSLIRLSVNQPYKRMHSYQLWYAPVLYLFFSLNLVIGTDIQLFNRTKMGNIFPVRHRKIEVVKLYLFKLFYFFYILALPLLVLPVPWWQIVTGFLIMHFIGGWIFACVGVLNHQIDESVFPVFDQDGYIRNNKKNHELETTIDFSPGSKLATYLFGGFNTHVAHHLFPDVCHCHYNAITRIISQTAPRYGLRYKKHSLLGAVHSHLRYLKRLSVVNNTAAQ